MSITKPQPLIMALAAGIFLATLPAHAATISSFNFTPADVDFLPGGTIDFDGDFVIDDFEIGVQTGGSGALFGLFGEIDSTFTFDTLGTVTTAGASFLVDDGVGDSTGADDILTGVLDFETIDFVDITVSEVVSLNGTLTFDSAYTGANADLFTLSTSGIQYLISADFFYTGLTTLDSLFAAGDAGGTLLAAAGQVAIPEPHSLAILGIGLVGIGWSVRKKKKDQSNLRRRPIRDSSQVDGTELAT